MKPERPEQNSVNQIRHPANVKHDIDREKFHLDGMDDVSFPAGELARGVGYDFFHVS